jgi:hypothetical protein
VKPNPSNPPPPSDEARHEALGRVYSLILSWPKAVDEQAADECTGRAENWPDDEGQNETPIDSLPSEGRESTGASDNDSHEPLSTGTLPQ